MYGNYFYTILFLKNYKNYFFYKNNFKLPTNKYKHAYKAVNRVNLNMYIYIYTHQTHMQYLNKLPTLNKIYHNFNYLTFLNLKRLEFFFYEFGLTKQNFVFLDSNYSLTYNIYKTSFDKQNLYRHRTLFFVKPKYFTYNNWSYYYSRFCLNNDIGVVVVLDFYYFKNFLKNLNKFNLISILLQPIDYITTPADYKIYTHSSFYLIHKFLYLNFLNKIFYSSKNNVKKINTLKFFESFFKKNNFYIG